jgi:hypothetical protein
MKRAVRIVAVAALCVAGSAVAQDRSGEELRDGVGVAKKARDASASPSPDRSGPSATAGG